MKERSRDGAGQTQLIHIGTSIPVKHFQATQNSFEETGLQFKLLGKVVVKVMP